MATRIQRALISVSNKAGVVEFARELASLGVEILSTGGTAKALRESWVAVTDVSQATGFPEMMDGRVKTLHPAIHGGLLALRDNPDHLQQIADQGIQPIDLVAVNLYPFAETISKPEVTEHDAIENIDIGGPSMVRSASKNFASVTIVVDPSDYAKVLEEIRQDGNTTTETRRLLAVKAFAHTSAYDAMIHDYLWRTAKAQGVITDDLPESLRVSGERLQTLRYGENPHQRGAFYRSATPEAGSIAAARQLSGKELSYNNLVDVDAAWQLACEFDEPAVSIIKHTNPCGCAVGGTSLEAYQRAWEADPVSRFGGIVALNRSVDGATATELVAPGNFYEVIIAPGFEEIALAIIQNRKGWGQNVRLLATGECLPSGGGAAARFTVRSVTGGFLVQDEDLHRLTAEDLKVVTARQPSDEEAHDLLFAFKVVKHVKSNAIVLAKDGALVGMGAGQPNRVISVQLAIQQAGEKVKGSVLASDAFFPFPDGPETAALAGVVAIIQPGGSTKDSDTIAVADQYGMAMVFTGVRHFRH
ncbi:MAG: bifunctional phosphoribosylaminoimidazolecarboxamide formyltransferase/IMP cyclohydrolase [Armatimonadetes bacterium]|nr:bifunctional phosphoribosylaminoimidazolecarboxamide formyltransferase/IMP cyclohydrolase [Armatimonadota bacterium]